MRRRSLPGKERIRLFTLHGGICHLCGCKINGVGDRWEIEHVLALELGGADDDANRKPVHYDCHKPKTADDLGKIAKANRQKIRHLGAYRSKRPVPGSKASPWKKKLDGTAVRREP